MIESSELIEIGQLGKPHGIKGELNAVIDESVDIERLEKVALDIDGIYVPFFFNSIRPKRHDSVIVEIDGIDSEEKAAKLVNKTLYAFIADDVKTEDEDGGLYASDLIGYAIVHADGRKVGVITDINDSTENALFIVELPNGKSTYIPIADELIDEINEEEKYIVMTLPEGILDL
ncbi:ribosome maturation factor RimM [uncultured Muribaculum sp.]|uniref:ribosome maturation factor RimM n=1 Tax=uncultured Muribaculum sp. TaxID=1918613 RepID=UPI0025992A18|nr:ribosome maturation factor RimM [uncultured Muribaculum sp.]